MLTASNLVPPGKLASLCKDHMAFERCDDYTTSCLSFDTSLTRSVCARAVKTLVAGQLSAHHLWEERERVLASLGGCLCLRSSLFPSNIAFCSQCHAASRKMGSCKRGCSTVAEDTVSIALKKATRQLQLLGVQRSTLAPLKVHVVRLVLNINSSRPPTETRWRTRTWPM